MKLLPQSLLPETSLLGFARFAFLAVLLCVLIIRWRRMLCYRGQRPEFQANDEVRQLCRRRLASKWFWLKVRGLVPLWSLCNFAARVQLRHDNRWLDNWHSVLIGAQYCIVLPRLRFTACGYACKRVYGDPTITIGLEAPILWVPAFRSSAIDHELMHCVQDYFVNLFNREAVGDGLMDNDLLDLEAFATRLKGSTEGINPHVRALLHPATRKALEDFPAGSDTSLRYLLLKDLNRLITIHTLFAEHPFREVELRPRTRRLLASPSRLNRLLIEDAYTTELSRRPSLTCLDWVQYELFAILAGPLWLSPIIVFLLPIVKSLFVTYFLHT